ncbi:hypothetical protein ABMA27_014866 [Loxostege sticticalis]|uniref:Reverse transcriptase domain-containing protein n=1 Tax=Loxostege sticticalis TaxID=481309 RepID=A0ABR3IAG8_LOXSC
MLSERGFERGISDYTRIERRLDKVTKSCIDHIYSRLTQTACSAAIDTVLADHRVILLASDGEGMSARIQADATSSIMEVCDYEIFYKELNSTDWSLTNTMKCPNKINDFIKSSFENAQIRSTKKITKTNRQINKTPWINQNILNLSKKRDELFKFWKKDTTNKCLRLQYNKTRNKVHKLIEYYRNNYYKNKIKNCNNNSKKLWQIINSICGRVTQSIDQLITRAFSSHNLSSTEIANKFANEFQQAVKAILPKCQQDLLDKNEYNNKCNKTILIKKATPDRILNIINGLHNFKAPGQDNIKTIDVKKISHNISIAIANLINTSLYTGIYPDDLKRGCVRPIYKKGKQSEVSNFRPVTVLSNINKIVEKYVSGEIHTFFGENNDIINKKQFGFQPHKSTTMLLTEFTDEINSYLNNRNHVLVLFVDFSRAFDTLDHVILCKKLENIGIQGPLLEWCNNYLKNRSNCVKVDNCISDSYTAEEGTAQGSVLGPLHFIGYVNDMVNVIKHGTSYQYADDTCIIVADRDLDSALAKIQKDFDELNKWCHDNKLVLNSNKTKLVHIRSPYAKNQADMNNKLFAHDHACLHSKSLSCKCPTIESVDKHTYLGLIIDSKFNWLPHINLVCEKLRAFLANMYVINNRIPFKTKLMLYNALAESIVGYGLTSYGRTFKSYLNCIYKLQVRILKMIVPSNINQKYINDELGLFKYCKILPINTKIQYSLLKEQFFNTKIQQNISHEINTRQKTKKKLIITIARNSYGGRTTSYIIPRLVNNLELSLKQSITPNNIKYKLKLHFLNSL